MQAASERHQVASVHFLMHCLQFGIFIGRQSARWRKRFGLLPEVFGPDSIENNAMSRWGAASRDQWTLGRCPQLSLVSGPCLLHILSSERNAARRPLSTPLLGSEAHAGHAMQKQ